MKKLFTTSFLLLFFAGFILAQDTAYYAKLINEPIWNISYKKDSNTVWLIAGEKHDKVFRIKNDKVKNITEEANLPAGIKYTAIQSLSNKHLLLGTENNYLIYLKNNHRYKIIDDKYGVMDSSILAIDLKKKDKMVFVTTPSSRYIIKHYNRSYNLHIVQIKDTARTLDELAYFVKYYVKLPIQVGICYISSDIDLSFRKKFINEETLKEIKRVLLPGDIMIKRNDHQLANVGIPGFWTHSGIYVGSLAQLDSVFSDIQCLEGLSPSNYIKENFPTIYEKLVNKENQIIEAIGDGVVINPVDHIGKVDYLAALRPQIDKEAIFQSLLAAFEFYGTPYDYLFDFQDDDTMVCSELVYRSFRETSDKKGVKFQFGTYNGRPFLSPNDIAKQFADERHSKNKQFSLVTFYDAEENSRISVRRSEKEFAKTWKRKFNEKTVRKLTMNAKSK